MICSNSRRNGSARRLAASLILAGALALASAGCSPAPAPLSPFERARLALGNGDGLGGELALREALNEGVKPETIAAYMGQAELLQGNVPEAREWLEDGQFSSESRALGFHQLGKVESLSGNLAAAGKAYDRALALDPKDAALWVDIGRLRYRGGEQLQAIEAARHAVALDPQSAEALQFRGQLVRDSFGYAASLPWFEAALKNRPNNVEILADYAATLGEAGRVHDMLAVTRKIARLDPGNKTIRYLHAIVAARGGNFALADSQLRASGLVERGVPGALMLSALIDIETKNFASAALVLDGLAQHQPDNQQVQLLLARALAASGADDELTHRFARAAQNRDAPPYLATLVARGYEALGERRVAARFFSIASHPRSGKFAVIATPTSSDRPIAPRSGDPIAKVRRQIASGRAERALRTADVFLKKHSGSADALVLDGDALVARGEFATALERYARSAQIRFPWIVSRKIIAAHLAEGDDDAAREALVSFVRRMPTNFEALGLLGAALASKGDWGAAARIIDHAIKLGGGRDPQLLALRARAAFELGDADLALSFARAAYALQPDNPLAIGALAQALARAAPDDPASRLLEARAEALRQPAASRKDTG